MKPIHQHDVSYKPSFQKPSLTQEEYENIWKLQKENIKNLLEIEEKPDGLFLPSITGNDLDLQAVLKTLFFRNCFEELTIAFEEKNKEDYPDLVSRIKKSHEFFTNYGVTDILSLVEKTRRRFSSSHNLTLLYDMGVTIDPGRRDENVDEGLAFVLTVFTDDKILATYALVG